MAMVALVQFQKLVHDLPQLPEDPADLSLRPGTEIYAASGERIYTFNQNRTWVSIDSLPPHLAQALLATDLKTNTLSKGRTHEYHADG